MINYKASTTEILKNYFDKLNANYNEVADLPERDLRNLSARDYFLTADTKKEVETVLAKFNATEEEKPEEVEETAEPAEEKTEPKKSGKNK